MKKIFSIIAVFLVAFLVVACTPETPTGTFYKVTFDTGEGGPVIPQQELKQGSKVTKPDNPTKEGYLFTGKWFNDSFEWNFAFDIVTSDITLVAEWLEISSTPSNFGLVDEPFTSKITWRQTDADLQNFTVSIKAKNGSNFVTTDGSFDIDTTEELHKVTFTPDVIPMGGLYTIKVEAGSEVGTSDELLLSGAGTQNNPYLVNEINDLVTILENEDFQSQNYLQINDLIGTITNPLEINNNRKATFDGVYDGGGFTISFTGNGGLFHEITASGVVKNLVIDSTTQLYAQESNVYPIGAVADNNYGLIDNINSRALLEDSHLQGALEVFTEVDSDNHTTGAGGIAGKNHTTGIISNVTVGGAGAVKAGRGIGGVVAYNFGLIEHASVSATLPAGNQANSANSSNTYSYAGGIVGFNFGTIQFTSVSGRVFAQSAYAPAGDGNEGKNVGFGGIAGYNEGLIKESSFARSLAAKEFIDKSRASELQDAANNLGVASIHGDLYIGGIAGINAGEIDSSYVGGAIIGGRDFVGGVSGLTLTGSNIHHTYVFAEIAIKDNGGNKVTTPNNKTTVTTYQIAPNGFDAASTLFKALFNSETDQTWVPGDVASPKLPVFNQEDLTKVGNKFSSAGTLLWQQGAVTGVNIILDNLVLPFGSTMDIEFSVTPTNAPDLYTIWTSSDDGVVAIIGEGKVQGIGVGTATITVTTRDGGHTDAITITVDDYIHVDEALVTAEIELPEPNNATVRSDIEIGTILNFEVVILPEDAEYKGYVISSSNSRAIVTGNQVEFVTGNTGPGNVSIIVSFEDASLGALEYRFKTIPAPVEGVPISEVLVTAGEYVLPSVNNSNDRQEIETGESFILSVEILPNNASNKNYTIESSQPGRATVTDHTVNVIGTGNFSIKLTFEDTTVGNGGVLEYRFLGVLPEVPEEDTPIENVVVTTDTVTLPEPNNQSDRPEVTIGTVMVITIEILPENATNQNYTITVSNSRAQVSGNTVTFVTGSGAGNVSVVITFEDTSIGNNGVLEYRFKTVVA